MKAAASGLLGSANGMLQSALVPGSGSNIPDCDGGGEDGLSDSSVDVQRHQIC